MKFSNAVNNDLVTKAMNDELVFKLNAFDTGRFVCS